MAHDRTHDRPDNWLIELLDDVGPEPPARVDLAHAISEGRRRIRRRRLAGVAGAMVAVVAAGTLPVTIIALDDRGAAPAPDNPAGPVTGPPAPASCRASRLPEPAESYQSFVTAADPTATYIAGRVYFAGPRIRVTFWDHGQQRDVDMPGEDGSLTDVNAHGVAVGYSYTGEGITTAWLYRDGRLTPLPGGNARAMAVNDRGDVVGNQSTEPWSTTSTPVVWRAGSDGPTPLPLPEGKRSASAIDIDTDGTILGEAFAPGDRSHTGYVWRPDGTATALAGLTGASKTWPAAIRDGWVVGQDVQDTGNIRMLTAARWNLDTGQVTEYPVTEMVSPHGVNSNGWVVGQRSLAPRPPIPPTVSGPATPVPSDRRAPDGRKPNGPIVIATDAGTVSLPGLETPNASGSFGTTMTITDDGRTVLGTAEDRDANPRATIWHCQ